MFIASYYRQVSTESKTKIYHSMTDWQTDKVKCRAASLLKTNNPNKSNIKCIKGKKKIDYLPEKPLWGKVSSCCDYNSMPIDERVNKQCSFQGFKSIDILLLRCCTRFSSTLLNIYSQLAKITIHFIHLLYPIPSPTTGSTNWPINEIHISNLNQRQISPC